MDEFHSEMIVVEVEEMDSVDADDINLVDAAGVEELGLEAVGRWGYDGGVVGVGAVAGDGGAVVAEVDVGFEAGYALAGDAGAFEAADELFGFAGEHGAGDDFHAAGDGCGHWAMVLGLVVDFWGLIFLEWWSGVFAGGFREKWLVERGFLLVSLWWIDGELWCVDRRILGVEKCATFSRFIFGL